MSPRLHFAAHTDTGRGRSENQDRWLVHDELQLGAVADGMGGLPHGSEAAQCALDTLRAAVARLVPQTPAEWRALLETLNREVFTLGLRLSPGRGLGSTLTLAHARGSRLAIAHVGDSGAFRLRAGVLECLTREHTVAAEVRERRAAGVPERMPRAAEHMLTSCLGLPFLPAAETFETDLAPGDRLLLCTDGLTKPVAFDRLQSELAAAPSPAAAVSALVGLALAAGGPDNITVVAAWADAAE